MNDKPYALIDVDGVLRCYHEHHDGTHPGWERHLLDTDPGEFVVHLNPLGRALPAWAAAAGAELAWATMWGEQANFYLSPLLGLGELPVVPPPQWLRAKASVAVPWTGGRPFVWFDDDPSEKQVADHLAVQPHLMVQVDREKGLQQRHLDRAQEWLARLRERTLA
jgi:hypothetical protein